MAPSADASSSKRSKRKSQEGTSSSSSPKKSKQSSSSDAKAKKDKSSGGVSVKVEKAFLKGDKASRGTSGVALATFADYKPPSSTTFNLYRADGLPVQAGGSKLPDERLVLAGETDTIEYLGDNFEYGSAPELRGYSNEYMIGIYDPSTSSVTLRPAPLFTVSRSIKALKDLAPISTEENQVTDMSSRMMARRALGDQFGNAKQKTTARNQDRMKVDTKFMEGYMDDVRAGIEEAASSMPSTDAIASMTEAARPAPPLNAAATHPADAYPLFELVPAAVLRAVPIKKLLECEDQDSVGALLPFPGPSRSKWLKRRMWAAIQAAQHAGGSSTTHIDFDAAPSAAPVPSNKEDAKNKVRLAFYVALLWAFQKMSPGKLGDRQELLKQLRLDHGEGSSVLEDLLARFTEKQKNTAKASMTPYMQSKQLNYFAALCLHLDNFAVNYTELAKDMERDTVTVRGAFKILGCKTSKRVTADIDLAPGQEKNAEAKVVLTCPVTLPKPSRGAPKKKQ